MKAYFVSLVLSYKKKIEAVSSSNAGEGKR
jgi:hypothetical protein